jgi:hypothetical protein
MKNFPENSSGLKNLPEDFSRTGHQKNLQEDFSGGAFA